MQDTAVLRVMRDGVVGHERQAPPPHRVRAGRGFLARFDGWRQSTSRIPKISLVVRHGVVHRDVMGSLADVGF